MRDLWLFLKLYGRHRLLLLLGILLAVVTLAASLGLLALSGWFITASSIAGLSVASAKLFNFFTPGAGVRGFSILRTASRYFERLVSHDATFRLLAWLREWFFSKLTPLSLGQISRYRKGDLLNRLVADVDALDQLYLRLLSPMVSAVMISVLLAAFLAWFSPVLALFSLMVMVSWILLMPVLFYRLGSKTGASLGNRQRDLRQQVLDHLQGMAEGLIYGYHHKSRSLLHKTEAAMQDDQQRMARLEGFGSFLFVGGAGCAAVGMLWLASGEYQLQHISGPVMALMVFAMLAGFEALMPLPGAFQFLSYTRQAAVRLREVIDEKPMVFPEQEERFNLKGHVRFEEVSFAYQQEHPGKRQIVSNLCLDILPGEHVALLGKTGCGKSTLIRLLNRGVEPDSGDILLDGRLIQSFTEKTLYKSVTFIPQRTHVYSASFRDNLLLAAPDASDRQLVDVIIKTGLEKLGGGAYENTADLLDLWVGHGGLSLSGGEQRRLAAARALLKPAPVLIMDEPTEGLDTDSEQALMRTVLKSFRDSAVIMITHKKVVLEQMDTIYQMDGGKVECVSYERMSENSA
ncbi:cysteine/glutathione ABC transporter ATP-binding protein/permease CydC [Endozoicomonas sp. Mp262]|uniref:heme ABC transporter ATP-binding protein/permease CydC n=1 Tax=Endozoicomonas sp. Mp262 TaxID=2919499 RepID=UPI0021D88BC3